MFRNTKDLVSLEGVHVDAHSLWQENNQGIMVLVDDDQYVTHPRSELFIRCSDEEE